MDSRALRNNILIFLLTTSGTVSVTGQEVHERPSVDEGNAVSAVYVERGNASQHLVASGRKPRDQKPTTSRRDAESGLWGKAAGAASLSAGPVPAPDLDREPIMLGETQAYYYRGPLKECRDQRYRSSQYSLIW